MKLLENLIIISVLFLTYFFLDQRWDPNYVALKALTKYVKNKYCKGNRSKVHNVTICEDFLIRYPLIAQKFKLNKQYLTNPQFQLITKNIDSIIFKSPSSIYFQQREKSKQTGLIFQQQHNNQHYNALFYQGQIDEFQKKNGIGKAIFDNGDVYEGQWKDNLIHGHGKFTSYGNKTIFQGNFNKFKKQGTGQLKVNNGNQNFTYKGNWKNDMLYGKGILKYEDQTSYEGDFHNGQQQGHGVYRTNSMIYEGGWKNGLMCGSGTAKWFSVKGEVTSQYTGEYLQGKKHGFGEYKGINGKILRGQWFKGKFTPGTNSYIID